MTSSCPLCNEIASSVVYEKLEQTPGAMIVKCSNCSHIYTLSSREQDYEKLYSDGIYKVTEIRKSIFDRIITWEYNRILRKIYSLKKQKGSLLDFGCGKGKFAGLAKEKGWRVKGIETATARAAYAKEVYGLEISTDTYFGGRVFESDFDVITMLHVLEHLPNPETILKELVEGNLKKGGILVLEVPNIQSWQASIARKRWMHLDASRHVSHFSNEKLNQITDDLGFSCKETSFFSFHLGVLGMTDGLLKILGYRKNIIGELKKTKNNVLLAGIICMLPLALILEIIAAVAGKGGISRRYLFFDQQNGQ